MMHWNLGWGEMMIGGLGMLALWSLLILFVLWGIRTLTGTGGGSTFQATGFRQTPLEILQGRYASGEISREEYERIRRDLNSTQA